MPVIVDAYISNLGHLWPNRFVVAGYVLWRKFHLDKESTHAPKMV